MTKRAQQPIPWGKALLALLLAGSLSAASYERLNEELDCVTVFDFLVALAAPNCAVGVSTSAHAPEIIAALELLTEQGFIREDGFENIDTGFCPLTNGLGLTPAPNTIYLDDGLQAASTDTLAEVLFHELQHVNQMRDMGTKAFKCAYIKSLAECGGCTDSYHSLEAPAYAEQARVRDALLHRWLHYKANRFPAQSPNPGGGAAQ